MMPDGFHCIDLNCDLGEYDDPSQGEADALIMPLISSCNIACGTHAGNADVMQQTIKLAQQNQVAIGAHPSYPDRENFGRLAMSLSSAKLKTTLHQQITLLANLAEEQGTTVAHVKPHGALYNQAAIDLNLAMLLCEVVADIDDSLLFYGLAHSAMQQAATEVGITFVAEAFADRAYTAHKTLVPRTQAGAVLTDEQMMLEQVVNLAKGQPIKAISGEAIAIQAKTICLHGDHAGAVQTAKKLNAGLCQAGISIMAPEP